MANQFNDNVGNSTLGMALLYGIGASADAVSTWRRIPDVKNLPALGSEPNGIDTTTIAETVQETQVSGLKSANTLEVTANFTNNLETCWNTGVCGAELEDDEYLYFCWYHPNLTKASAFVGDPTPLDFGDSDVNSVLETSLYITMASSPVRITKPSVADILEYDDVSLSTFTIGALTLNPTFDPNTFSYTVSGAGLSANITATAKDTDATVVIKNGTTTVTSGSSASFAVGDNTVTVTVTNGTKSAVYTAIVNRAS